MPLDFCGAESQGTSSGTRSSRAGRTSCACIGAERPVITVLTQAMVDREDPAFGRPTKPIGPFYSAAEAAKLREEKGWTIEDIPGKGFRRLVASPRPISIMEGGTIRDVFEDGYVVIACGGGGIPVIEKEGQIAGVEAVVDKDHSAALLANLIGACSMLILTDVEAAYLDHGTEKQRAITEMTATQAGEWLAQGQFGPGTMGPKVESAIEFLNLGGKKAIITSMDRAAEALAGKAGTTITG